MVDKSDRDQGEHGFGIGGHFYIQCGRPGKQEEQEINEILDKILIKMNTKLTLSYINKQVLVKIIRSILNVNAGPSRTGA